MTTTLALTADQLSTPEVIADPYPYSHVRRDQLPLNYRFLPAGGVRGFDEPIRAWALMRHDDVYNALRGHDTFSSRHCLVGKIGPPLALINDDPPRHTRFRRLVNKTFTLKRYRGLDAMACGLWHGHTLLPRGSARASRSTSHPECIPGSLPNSHTRGCHGYATIIKPRRV
jgi:cytochrome P450